MPFINQFSLEKDSVTSDDSFSRTSIATTHQCLSGSQNFNKRIGKIYLFKEIHDITIHIFLGLF